MSDTKGPACGPSQPLRHKDSGLEISRFEYKTITKADCNLAWRIFSDCEGWAAFSDLYRNVQWRGFPWAPGSRLEMQITRPAVTRIDRVITVCTPPRCVAWIGHGSGYSWEQWVLFEPHAGTGAKISTWVEVVGARLPRENGFRDLVRQLHEEWYESFRSECDRTVERRR
jgi:hypothetical protein